VKKILTAMHQQNCCWRAGIVSIDTAGQLLLAFPVITPSCIKCTIPWIKGPVYQYSCYLTLHWNYNCI